MINLENIDVLKERANVSYQEAKEALELCDGNLVDALIYLEKSEKIRPERKAAREKFAESSQNFGEETKKVFEKMGKHRFMIQKDGETFLNIPSVLALILIICTFPVSVVLLVLGFVFGYKYRVRNKKGKAVEVIEKIKETFADTAPAEKE
jgi:hypothetical protein